MAKHEFSKDYHYQWSCHFLDGTVMEQFPEDGTYHRFHELEERAGLIDYLQISGLHNPIIINFPPNSLPIIFERHRRSEDHNGTIEEVWSFFGYETPTNKTLFVIHQATGLLSIEFDDSKIRA